MKPSPTDNLGSNALAFFRALNAQACPASLAAIAQSHARAIIAATDGDFPNWISIGEACSAILPHTGLLPASLLSHLASRARRYRIGQSEFLHSTGQRAALFEACLDAPASVLASEIIQLRRVDLRPGVILRALRASESKSQAAHRFARALEEDIVDGAILTALALHSRSWGLGFSEVAGVERERRALARTVPSIALPPIKKNRL